MKPKVHFRACYTSMGIRGPTSRSKSAQAQEKTHFRQNQKQTQGSKGQMTSLTHLTFGGHPQANTGSPQGVHRPKMRPDGLRKGSAKPLGRPTPTGPNQAHLFPVNSHRIPYAGSRWYHLKSSPKDPLFEGYRRRRRAPNSRHQYHVELVLHCKGEALPRLVLSVAGA